VAVVDTNVLVYDTFEDSIFHRHAARLLDELDEWIIPEVVVYEYVCILRELEVSAEDLEDKLRDYLLSPKSKLVCGGSEVLLAAASLLRREKLSLSRFNDKVILITAKRLAYPLATFDRRLRKQATSSGVRVLPEQYPTPQG